MAEVAAIVSNSTFELEDIPRDRTGFMPDDVFSGQRGCRLRLKGNVLRVIAHICLPMGSPTA